MATLWNREISGIGRVSFVQSGFSGVPEKAVWTFPYRFWESWFDIFGKGSSVPKFSGKKLKLTAFSVSGKSVCATYSGNRTSVAFSVERSDAPEEAETFPKIAGTLEISVADALLRELSEGRGPLPWIEEWTVKSEYRFASWARADVVVFSKAWTEAAVFEVKKGRVSVASLARQASSYRDAMEEAGIPCSAFAVAESFSPEESAALRSEGVGTFEVRVMRSW